MNETMNHTVHVHLGKQSLVLCEETFISFAKTAEFVITIVNLCDVNVKMLLTNVAMPNHICKASSVMYNAVCIAV